MERAMDVGGWLRSLDRDQYEPNFRENKIDADVLPQLTADDLKDIGVSVIGDRRRLLAAIAAFASPTPLPLHVKRGRASPEREQHLRSNQGSCNRRNHSG
jgi:SAM domain (Sterile alpha motif)